MHVLIIGMTMSGKTTLAKHMCHKFRQSGVDTIVLDPLNDPEWDATFQTRDGGEFLRVAKANRSCALFIDESGEAIGRYNDAMEWTATRARHWGHKTHFLCQRAVQVSPTLRDQCASLYAFCVSKSDSKTLAEEFNQDVLLKCSELPKLTCYCVGRFQKAKRLKVPYFNLVKQKGVD